MISAYALNIFKLYFSEHKSIVAEDYLKKSRDNWLTILSRTDGEWAIRTLTKCMDNDEENLKREGLCITDEDAFYLLSNIINECDISTIDDLDSFSYLDDTDSIADVLNTVLICDINKTFKTSSPFVTSKNCNKHLVMAAIVFFADRDIISEYSLDDLKILINSISESIIDNYIKEDLYD